MINRNPPAARPMNLMKLTSEGMNCRYKIPCISLAEKEFVKSINRKVIRKKKINEINTLAFFRMLNLITYILILFIFREARSMVPTPISSAITI